MLSTKVKSLIVAACATMLAGGASVALAQHAHSDIEFRYEGGKIAVEFGDEGQVFEGEFSADETDPFVRFTDDPGFESESAEGLGVNPGDIIDYEILGPLGYHDGTDFAPVAAGVNILIEDNPSGSLTVDGVLTGPASGGGFIGQAESATDPDPGDVHTHIDFTLSDGAPFGAYGLLMRLTTDAAGIAPSDPFYIVFDYGMNDEEAFEGAVGAFAARVPEPNTAIVIGLAIIGLAGKRRRR